MDLRWIWKDIQELIVISTLSSHPFQSEARFSGKKKEIMEGQRELGTPLTGDWRAGR